MGYLSKALVVKQTGTLFNQQLRHCSNKQLTYCRSSVYLLPSTKPRYFTSSTVYRSELAANNSCNSTSVSPPADGVQWDQFVLPPPPVPSPPSVGADLLTPLPDFSLWPPTLVQYGLDWMHSLGLPWWACIVSGAIAIRIIMIPLFAAVQRNSRNQSNHAPETSKFTMDLMVAQQRGDRTGALKVLQDQKEYYKRNDINPYRLLRLAFAQGSVFCSVFFGLEKMATLPVESFKTGGLLHIVDLTVRDPLFITPLIVSGTMAFILYSGAEGQNMDMLPPIMKKLMLAMPVIIFFPTAYFPAALGVYWITSNICSLGQFYLFKSEFGKKFFRIPDIRPIQAGDLNMFNQGFAEAFAKAMETANQAAQTQMKIQSMQLPDDRRKWDALKGVGETPSQAEIEARQAEVKRMIKEIGQMKEKLSEIDSSLDKNSSKKPADIHIKIDEKELK